MPVIRSVWCCNKENTVQRWKWSRQNWHLYSKQLMFWHNWMSISYSILPSGVSSQECKVFCISNSLLFLPFFYSLILFFTCFVLHYIKYCNSTKIPGVESCGDAEFLQIFSGFDKVLFVLTKISFFFLLLSEVFPDNSEFVLIIDKISLNLHG